MRITIYKSVKRLTLYVCMIGLSHTQKQLQSNRLSSRQTICSLRCIKLLSLQSGEVALELTTTGEDDKMSGNELSNAASGGGFPACEEWFRELRPLSALMWHWSHIFAVFMILCEISDVYVLIKISKKERSHRILQLFEHVGLESHFYSLTAEKKRASCRTAKS